MVSLNELYFAKKEMILCVLKREFKETEKKEKKKKKKKTKRNKN